ncbi:hypothetical protein PR003_g18617 [Phytophthora rubi]|uniref:Crinkler effector protein N-terminal domain-containing protein n=1 Tax=Phytophthora rubi TaxID=129364 RepID=A0A6A3K078_9STRA|nr:hypothetical protein PR002_g18052 [Phytophthora rubi]KAE9004388.1 hypothetical protein PR001_g17725 [Phytophthora rubi]KAE9316871.1 hypothetical protein PR003_g18617 [Phytophthora rubi]
MPPRGKIVTLYCAVAGVARSAFPVDIDDSLSVGHLKDAIKPKINYSDPAYKLHLFLARKDDAWLTEADVIKGVDDATDLKPLGGAGAPLNLVDLSEDKVRFQFTKEHVVAKTTPVHVLVVVPEQEFTGKRTRSR